MPKEKIKRKNKRTKKTNLIFFQPLWCTWYCGTSLTIFNSLYPFNKYITSILQQLKMRHRDYNYLVQITTGIYNSGNLCVLFPNRSGFRRYGLRVPGVSLYHMLVVRLIQATIYNY